jgi:Holliday junction resolvase RusA-like endonuclease
VISFEVLGLPSPQGSKTRMPNGAMLDGRSKGARDRHRDWRSSVAQAARDVAEHEDITAPLDGALTLGVEFRFPMPKSRSKRLREIGYNPKTTAPDLDKLVRALCDGLQAGGLITDDARFHLIAARKVEVVGWTGAAVAVDIER